jgi:uncharacterized protein YdaU (DUF1376 family)
MDLPQLTDEQLERVREFFTSDASALLWRQLETKIIADWLVAEDPAKRERCWHEIQAVLQLQAKLRDAKANTRLSQRTQNVRETNTRTEPYGPV